MSILGGPDFWKLSNATKACVPEAAKDARVGLVAVYLLFGVQFGGLTL